MKCCYREGKEIPPIELIAEEIGCNITRLETAIRATQQSRSLDEPVMGQSIRAGAAGGDMVGDELLISDTIECSSRGSSQALISETEFGKCNGFRIVATRERCVEITTRTG
jgi:hypothetical protein